MSEQAQSRVFLWVVIGGGAFFLFVMAVFTMVYLTMQDETTGGGFRSFGDKIAVVELEGVILTPREVVRQLKRYGDDRSVKAIVLRINTPGGGAAASQEIHSMVKRLRKDNDKHIVASIESVGASGGYYVAAAADQIFADPASVVGSIGVIAQWYNYAELVKWAKLKEVILKAGEMKDAGSPTRDLTPAERKYFQDIIDDMHAQFINAVAEGREMEMEEVRRLADGRVWTGAQALELGLIDQLGDFHDAVYAAAEAVGIRGEPVIIRPERHRRTLLDVVFSDASEWLPDRAKLMQTHVGFYYLWK
jgi:protease IV